jgi:hypothetical protein
MAYRVVIPPLYRNRLETNAAEKPPADPFRFTGSCSEYRLSWLGSRRVTPRVNVDRHQAMRLKPMRFTPPKNGLVVSTRPKAAKGEGFLLNRANVIRPKIMRSYIFFEEHPATSIHVPTPKAVDSSESATMTSFVSFARRKNHDSSIDSICTKCYQTIASANSAVELNLVEQSHMCDRNGEFNYRHRMDFQQESL